MNLDPPIAFAADPADRPALEIRVNFGILAGREATPAEIDELARDLLAVVEDVTIVSEQHYQVGRGHEATVHQVRVSIADEALPDDEGVRAALGAQILEASGRWAETCAAERHAEL